MHYLYNISIWLYAVFIRIAAFFNHKAKLWINGRRGIAQLISSKSDELKGCVWFHCASLGEFEMARPLIEKLRKEKPSSRILITFFSPSGYEVRKNYEMADLVLYLPVDLPSNAKHFVQSFQPSLAVFAKYEFWHNYLHELKRDQVPSFCISAVFRPEQRFFKWYGTFFRKALRCFDMIFVQDKASHDQLRTIGVDSVVSGDTRFDRVAEHALSVDSLPELEQFKEENFLLVAGSSWPQEETIISSVFNENAVKWKLIITPHDISETHLKQIENALTISAKRYSVWKKDKSDVQVLIIDNIGMLSSVYALSDVAFIGGGFTGKLHNILEPAAFGNAVLFGPKHSRFHEANSLIKKGGAFEIHSSDDLIKFLKRFEVDGEWRTQVKIASSDFIASGKGAVEMIYISIQSYIA